jgi:hypothetical protein
MLFNIFTTLLISIISMEENARHLRTRELLCLFLRRAHSGSRLGRGAILNRFLDEHGTFWCGCKEFVRKGNAEAHWLFVCAIKEQKVHLASPFHGTQQISRCYV